MKQQIFDDNLYNLPNMLCLIHGRFLLPYFNNGVILVNSL